MLMIVYSIHSMLVIITAASGATKANAVYTATIAAVTATVDVNTAAPASPDISVLLLLQDSGSAVIVQHCCVNTLLLHYKLAHSLLLSLRAMLIVHVRCAYDVVVAMLSVWSVSLGSLLRYENTVI